LAFAGSSQSQVATKIRITGTLQQGLENHQKSLVVGNYLKGKFEIMLVISLKLWYRTVENHWHMYCSFAANTSKVSML
jgi:hypothetical protein